MINWNEQRRIKKRRRNIAAVILLFFFFLGGLGAAYVVSALQPVQAASKVKKRGYHSEGNINERYWTIAREARDY
ncbi:hypothetical protein GCM10020331_036210 [Ectobacillus funiculus]